MIEEFIKLSEERKAQKLRGLNNYNILTAVRKANAEVGMHSNFLYSLLNTEGDHYQGDLFARLFAKYVLDIQDLGKNIKVTPEFASENRRIDFVLESDTYMVGIEMKIDAGDQDKQIADYYDYLVKNAKDKTVKMYYLTPHIKKASEKSHRNRPYIQISFKDHIIKWLNEAQKQVPNITNLNNAITYYRDVVKMIIGKYESPLYDYKTFFLDKKRGENRYRFFKNTEFEKLEVESRILTQKEWHDEVKIMEADFKKATQYLYKQFFEKLLNPILEQNSVLKYHEFNDKNKDSNGGKVIFLRLCEKYNVRLYIKNNHFATMSIDINYEYNWESEYELETHKNTLAKKLGNYKGTVNYITGKTKGVKLNSSYQLPELTVEKLYSKNVEKINKDISDEINKHLKIFIETLQDN